MADNNRCHGRCHVSENRELASYRVIEQLLIGQLDKPITIKTTF